MNEDPPEAGGRVGRAPSLAGTIRAVGLGLISDIAATLAASVVLSMVFGARLAGDAATPEELERALLASDGYTLLALAAGLSCTVLGGYVAARVAGEREYYHALLTGIAVLVFGEMMLAQSAVAYPFAYRLLGNLLVIPAALYGGHLRKRARLRA
jgi:hypothetical protein